MAGFPNSSGGGLPVNNPTFTGVMTGPDFAATGITGAVTPTRFVGGTAAGPPTAGTFIAGDYVMTLEGIIWVCTVGGTPGTWRAVPTWQQNDYSLPTGVLAQTSPRQANSQNVAVLATTRLQLVAIGLLAGVPITNIAFASSTTALSVGVNQWFALFDSGRNKLAVTADDGATAWPAETIKSLAIAGGPYTPAASGLYYLGICVVATTVPSLRCFGGSASNGVENLAPILSGSSTSGLTNPASCPATAAALTGNSNSVPYAYVS